MKTSALSVPFHPGATLKDRLMVALGLIRLTDDEQHYMVAFNLFGGMILAFITTILEIIMLVQNLTYRTQPEVIETVGWSWVLQHRGAYVVQLVSAVILLAGVLYHYLRAPLGIGTCKALLSQYMVIAMAFGIYIAIKDIDRGHGVYALLTQMVALACVFSIRPSIYVPSVILALTVTMSHADRLGVLSRGDRINLTMLFVIIVISCCMRYYTTVHIARDRLLLQERAHSDGLTGLGNVHALRRDMPQLVGHQISASVLDIDSFKLCNDKLGHAVGNTILTLLANALRESFDSYGTCYRTGGDEFVAISVDLTQKRQLELVNETVGHFLDRASEKGILVEGKPVMVSTGTAHGLVNKVSDVDDLLQLADQAMYRMKWEREGHQSADAGAVGEDVLDEGAGRGDGSDADAS